MLWQLRFLLQKKSYICFDTFDFCSNIHTQKYIAKKLQKLADCVGNHRIAVIHYENMSYYKHFDEKFVDLVNNNRDSIEVFVEGHNKNFVFENCQQHNDYFLELSRKAEPKIIAHKTKPKDFLLLINREDKPRIDLAKKLKARNLLQNSLVSVNAPSFDMQIKLPPEYDWDSVDQKRKDLFWLVHPFPRQYEATKYSIVCESVCDEKSYQISEKTYKTMMMFHPFVMLGPPGMLEYIRSKGFKTFHPFINESYDQETNLQKRINMIAEVCGNLHQQDWRTLYNQTFEIRRHNYNLFYSARPTFLSPIYDDLKDSDDHIWRDTGGR